VLNVVLDSGGRLSLVNAVGGDAGQVLSTTGTCAFRVPIRFFFKDR
jgi:hypothetical protein